MKYAFEFIGTFVFTMTVGMVVIQPGAAPVGFPPIAIGIALAALVYAGGHICGAHYNPAVSLAVYVRGDKSSYTFTNLLLYWVVQLLAGLMAASIVIYFKSSLSGVVDEPMSVLHIDASQILLPSLLAEFIGTFTLVYIVLNVIAAKGTSGNSFYGAAMGMAFAANLYVFGAISGGICNPALALTITQLGISNWSNLWIYWGAEVAGGVAAALVFIVAHPGE